MRRFRAFIGLGLIAVSAGAMAAATVTAKPSVIRADTNLGLIYRNDKLAGNVGTGREECESPRTIYLKKVKPGTDAVVDSLQTYRRSDFYFRPGRDGLTAGRYYVSTPEARVTGPPTIICGADASRVIELDDQGDQV